MSQIKGASASGPGSRPSDGAQEGSTLTDPSREMLIQRVILAITTASVPHKSPLPGALESRSLGYYLGVGIDHFGHDFARHEVLLRKAAEQAIAALAQHGRSVAHCPGCGGEGMFHNHPCPALAEGLRRAASAGEARSATDSEAGVAEGEHATRQGDAQETNP